MMLETKYLYLWVNVFVISIPLLRSFEHRVAFYKSFKAIVSAIAITASFFLIWDIIFTSIGVWGFNTAYLSGISFFGLPLGEYLFFFTIPYACLFTFRSLNYFIKKDVLGPYSKHISNYIIGLSSALAILFYDRWYTVMAFSLLAAFTAYMHYVVKPNWLGRFYFSYFVCLIPFFLVNGILTGGFTKAAVVWYNEAEIIGIRIGTIPFEDAFYGLLLMMMTTFFYQKFWRPETNK